MRFTLVDRIIELQPARSISTVKCLSLAEEYLADHFPLFPVMPGVLMLEAMTQAGAWLIRVTEDFAHSVVVLKEARNIKYADFVAPGQVLTVHAEIVKQDATQTQLKARGEVDGKVAVSGRLVLERYNLAAHDAARAVTDIELKKEMRKMLAIIYQPAAPNHAAAEDLASRGGAAKSIHSLSVDTN